MNPEAVANSTFIEIEGPTILYRDQPTIVRASSSFFRTRDLEAVRKWWVGPRTKSKGTGVNKPRSSPKFPGCNPPTLRPATKPRSSLRGGWILFLPFLCGTRTRSVLVCIPRRSVGTRRTRRRGHGRNRNQASYAEKNGGIYRQNRESFRFIADLWGVVKVTRASSSGPISRICHRLEAWEGQTRMVWLPSTRTFP